MLCLWILLPPSGAHGRGVRRSGQAIGEQGSGTLRYLWPKAAERLASQAQLYAQAAHCYEELLLHSPQSVPLHVQYADVLYTMGGGNVRTARRHYAAAVKLSGGENLRALYGICCTAAALVGQKVCFLTRMQRGVLPAESQ